VVTPQLIVAIFLLAQAWDGLLTYAGIRFFGPSAEGNPLLAACMQMVGPETAIVGAKLFASACGVLLHCLGTHRVLLGLTILYGTVAVGPWLVVFHTI
jgi:Domain of unknown function (DUF5658)